MNPAGVGRGSVDASYDDPEAFTEVRRAIRDGIAEVLGKGAEPVDGFRARDPVAHSNATADATPHLGGDHATEDTVGDLP